MTPLFAEIIAICSAMGWAGDSVLVRFGLHQSNIFAAMLVSYSVSITCMWSYLIATTSLDGPLALPAASRARTTMYARRALSSPVALKVVPVTGSSVSWT